MEELLEILRDSIPEAIGGLTVAVIVALTVWMRSKRRVGKPRPKYDVYISYPVRDRPVVQQLVDALEARGLNVFWDMKIELGEDYQNVLDSELTRASAVGFCITPSAGAARGVLDEISKALARAPSESVTLIPIVMPGASVADIPDRLSRFWAVNLANGINGIEIDALVKRLRNGD